MNGGRKWKAPWVHRQHGCLMNWYGNQGGEGFEHHPLVLGLAVARIVGDGGVWSLDALVARWGNAS
jgi:putative oxidoreductase